MESSESPAEGRPDFLRCVTTERDLGAVGRLFCILANIRDEVHHKDNKIPYAMCELAAAGGLGLRSRFKFIRIAS